MAMWHEVWDEIKAIMLVAAYFAAWIGSLMLLKTLILEEYHIQFSQWSLVLIGALVLSKVVLILELVPLGAWTRSKPALFDVLLRTAMYSLGVLVVLVLEKGFEGRHDYGGFGESLAALAQQADAAHILANTICLSGALLVYNALSVIRRGLGDGGLARLFLSPVPETHERRD